MADGKPSVRFLKTFEGSDGYAVTIDADGTTVYAYLQKHGTIVGDVWLFNLLASPCDPPWKKPGEPPFMNAAEFAHEFDGASRLRPEDFRVMLNRKTEPLSAVIYLRNHLLGIVYEGKSPGKSRYAKCDSPVALRMANPNGPLPD